MDPSERDIGTKFVTPATRAIDTHNRWHRDDPTTFGGRIAAAENAA